MNEGKKDRRDPIRTIKAKNPVAKNANKAIGGGAAGAHKDKKKAAKQGDVKHKKAEYAESLQNKLDAVLAEGFFGDIKQSFATGMVDKLKNQDFNNGYNEKPQLEQQGVAEADPNAPYTSSPAKPFRNPPGFNKQGTGVGNKLAQQNRAELANIKPSKGTPVPAKDFAQGIEKDLQKAMTKPKIQVKKNKGVAEDTDSWFRVTVKTPNGKNHNIQVPANSHGTAKRKALAYCAKNGITGAEFVSAMRMPTLDEQGVAEGKSAINFSADDLKRLEKIRDLPTLKAQAFELISKPSAKPMKPEKVEWFKQALENMNSPIKVIKLMYDLLLSGEGNAVVGSKSSMNPNSYRQRFGEQGMAEEMDIPQDGTPEYDQFINRGGVNQKTPFDLGGADAYYGRQHDITAEYGFQKGSPEWDEYIQGYRDTYQNSDMRKDYGGGRSAVHPRRITKTSEAMNGITGPGMMRDPAMEAPEEPEGDTLKNSLHTIIRVATHLDKRLSVNDDFPEWVSEKVGAVKGMMVNVMDYLISDQEMSHDTDAMEDTALTQHRKRSSQADADFAKREAARKKNPGAASSDRIKELEKRYPAKEGWTHDSLADQLFEHERTYEEKLANDLKRKLGK
jgi:hypothetical protein